ncbi:hypothetical protein MJA45_27335 [Paenibacillus aurantius]|uniref:Uncharacterized protein n=1 Tax=Paenibacillus aurantius TaxID=2918900 RepID=A0AA96LDZ6_9BACL|nr:hypothetical protein [Paenibacillus aurantius]WNQ11268.1 hypothetical protein MJA45_27335 [Paenibacillus aurantius]
MIKKAGYPMDTIMTLTRNHWHQLMSNCYLTIHEYCRDRDLKAAMMKKAYFHELQIHHE